MPDCKHCSTPFTPKRSGDEYCCKGCEYVYNLIHQQGLDRFYELRQGASAPIGSTVFNPRDYSWLTALVHTQRKADASKFDLSLDIQGISCVGCVWLIEKLFMDDPGAMKIQINAQLGKIRMFCQAHQFDVLTFANTLQRFGYTLGPPTAAPKHKSKDISIRLGLCAAFALNAMLFTLPRYFGMQGDFLLAPLFEILTALFATLSLTAGGLYFIIRAWKAITHNVLHIDLPIALGIVIAYASSLIGWLGNINNLIYFDFVATFIFLMLLGRWLQEFALEKNRNRLLRSNATPQAVTLVAASTSSIPVEQLQAGQTIAVAAGQVIPVSSQLLEADANISLEWINGESEPVHWTPARRVPSGAINIGSQTIRLQTMQAWNESLLSRLLKASDQEFRYETLERVLKYYICTILIIAGLGTMLWLWQGAPITALQVAVSVLVVSCPCALGVALPLVNEFAVTHLRRAGVFVNDASLWGRLAKVKKIIFDKTGTLTLEQPALTNEADLLGLSPEHKQVLLSMVEDNPHPVSKCLRELLYTDGIVPLGDHPAMTETVGFGIQCTIHGHRYSLGRPGWIAAAEAEATPTQAGQDCEFCIDGKLIASFAFKDALRSNAKHEIQALMQAGYPTYILSGDRQHKVAAMLEALGLPQKHGLAELSPEDKAAWLATNAPTDALMIGDGANDSLAFEQAVCRGTPVVDRSALEHKADFYFLGQSLQGIRTLLQAATRRKQWVTAIFIFSISYNAIAVSYCLAGLVNPIVAAIVMPLSSLISIAMATLFKLSPCVSPLSTGDEEGVNQVKQTA